MKILIIGTTGYLGKPLVEYFKNNKLEVFTLNRRKIENSTPNDYVLVDNEFNFENLNEIIRVNKITHVINLAWIGSYGDLRFSKTEQEKNMKMVEVLAEVIKANGVKLITTGTISEKNVNDDGVPPSEYAIMKDKVHTYLNLTLGEKSTWVVLGNVYGGIDNTNRFVINTLGKLVNNEDITINTNGTQLFNPLYISDFTSFMLQILLEDLSGEVILTAPPIELRDFIYTAKEVLNSESNVKFGSKKEYMPKITSSHKILKSRFPLEWTIREASKFV